MDKHRLIELIEFSILVVERTGDLSPGELPRLSQVLLGNMMFRQDAETAVAISKEIDPEDPTLSKNIMEMWQEKPPQPRGPLMEGMDLCDEFVAAVNRTCGPQGYKLIRVRMANKQWGRVAREFPGRDGQSLRDDYDDLLRLIEIAVDRELNALDDFLKKNVVDPKKGILIFGRK